MVFMDKIDKLPIHVRYLIYLDTLEYLKDNISDRFYGAVGFCSVLGYKLQDLDIVDDIGDMDKFKAKFPEIYAYKKNETYWFKNDVERIKAIKKVIKDLELKINKTPKYGKERKILKKARIQKGKKV